jgi:hypothetical protein
MALDLWGTLYSGYRHANHDPRSRLCKYARRPRHSSTHSTAGFVVDKVALGQVFSGYFSFPCQYSFHQFLHHHNHPGQVQLANQWPPFRVDPAGLHPPLRELKKNMREDKNINFNFCIVVSTSYRVRGSRICVFCCWLYSCKCRLLFS